MIIKKKKLIKKVPQALANEPPLPIVGKG